MSIKSTSRFFAFIRTALEHESVVKQTLFVCYVGIISSWKTRRLAFRYLCRCVQIRKIIRVSLRSASREARSMHATMGQKNAIDFKVKKILLGWSWGSKIEPMPVVMHAICILSIISMQLDGTERSALLLL
jgi:hypothetical protein